MTMKIGLFTIFCIDRAEVTDVNKRLLDKFPFESNV